MKDQMNMPETESNSDSMLCEKEDMVVLGLAFLTTGFCWLAKEPVNQCLGPVYLWESRLESFGLEIYKVDLVWFVHRCE